MSNNDSSLKKNASNNQTQKRTLRNAQKQKQKINNKINSLKSLSESNLKRASNESSHNLEDILSSQDNFERTNQDDSFQSLANSNSTNIEDSDSINWKKIHRDALNLPLNSAKLLIKTAQRPANAASEGPIALGKGISRLLTRQDSTSKSKGAQKQESPNAVLEETSPLDSWVPTTSLDNFDVASSLKNAKNLIGLLTKASVYANIDDEHKSVDLEDEFNLITEEEDEVDLEKADDDFEKSVNIALSAKDSSANKNNLSSTSSQKDNNNLIKVSSDSSIASSTQWEDARSRAISREPTIEFLDKDIISSGNNPNPSIFEDAKQDILENDEDQSNHNAVKDNLTRVDTRNDFKTKMLQHFEETFHLPNTEKIIKTYLTWLLKDVLVQGHLFITNSHLLFFAFLPQFNNSIIMSGNLNVHSRLRTSTRYWCVLKDNSLSLYSSPTDIYFPIMTIDLRDVEQITLLKSNKPQLPTKDFQISLSSKKFKFTADSEYSAKSWFNSLKRQHFSCQYSKSSSISVKIPLTHITKMHNQKIADEILTLHLSALESSKGFAIDEYIFVFLDGLGHDVCNSLTKQMNILKANDETTLYQNPELVDQLRIELDRRRIRKDQRNTKRLERNEELVSTGLNAKEGNEVSVQSPPQEILKNDSKQYLTLLHAINPAAAISYYQDKNNIKNLLPSKLNPSKYFWLKENKSTVDEKINLISYSSIETDGSPLTQVSPKFIKEGPDSDRRSRSSTITEEPTCESEVPYSPSSEHNEKNNKQERPSLKEQAQKSSGRKLTDSTISIKRIATPIKNITGVLSNHPVHYSNKYIEFASNDRFLVKEEEARSAKSKFVKFFTFDGEEELIATYAGYLNRSVPVYGKIFFSRRYICFKSSLPKVNITMVLPLNNIDSIYNEKGFRFGYYGLVFVVHGNEELFFEFTSSSLRDDINELVTLRLNTIDVEDEKLLRSQATEDISSNISTNKIRFFEDSINNKAHQESVPLMLDYNPYLQRSVAPKKSLKFGLLTIGSRGDVQPYIALGQGLLKDGHKVIIITHQEFKGFVESHNMGFKEIAGNPAALMSFMAEHESVNLGMLREASRKFSGWIKDLLETSWTACKETNPDVLIESPSAMAGIHIAEALQIPYFRAFTMPWTRTRAYPHAFIVPDQNRGGSYNYFTHVLFENIFWKGTSGHINRWRVKTLGLEKTNLTIMQQNRVPFLYNVSPTIFPPAIDFSEWTKVTGYWFLDEKNNYKPPEALINFIKKARTLNKKLVYIGFGSIVVDNAYEMTKHIIEGVELSGTYCILNKGWSDRLSEEPSSNIVFPDCIYDSGNIPHDWLFPQIDVAVHHGGSGTTGASLRAGIPTIIKPFFGDQFFYAMRVEEIGAGLSLRKLNGKTLSKVLIKATTEKKLKVKAQLIKKEISKESGVATAINCIYGEMDYAKSLIKQKGKQKKGLEILNPLHYNTKNDDSTDYSNVVQSNRGDILHKFPSVTNVISNAISEVENEEHRAILEE